MLYGFLHRCSSLFTAGFLIACLPAAASLITFSNRTAFDAATSGRTDLTFEGIVATDSAQDFPNPAGLTIDGLTFRTSGTGPFGSGAVSVYGAGLAAQSALLNTGTGAILVWAPPDQPGTAFLDVLLLPSGKTAFATDLWAQQPFITTVRAIVNTGEATQNFDFSTVDRPTPFFFGVTSDAPILLVRFAIPAGQVGLILDNVSVGTAGSSTNPVPEPGTMVLPCAGLVGITVLWKRKHN